jgi:hypothetical protein
LLKPADAEQSEGGARTGLPQPVQSSGGPARHEFLRQFQPRQSAQRVDHAPIANRPPELPWASSLLDSIRANAQLPGRATSSDRPRRPPGKCRVLARHSRDMGRRHRQGVDRGAVLALGPRGDGPNASAGCLAARCSGLDRLRGPRLVPRSAAPAGPARALRLAQDGAAGRLGPPCFGYCRGIAPHDRTRVADMGQFLVRVVGDTMWLAERPLTPEETRSSIDAYLELSGSTAGISSSRAPRARRV